jgi:hypothetical protein
MIERQGGPTLPRLQIEHRKSAIQNPSASGGNRTHIARKGDRFTGGLAAHRASEGASRSSGTGGIRTHSHQGLSLAARPVCVPCLFWLGDWGSEIGDWKKHGRACARVSSHLPSPISDPRIESAQWESNPHIRHGKATGSRYIMGAKKGTFWFFGKGDILLFPREKENVPFSRASGGDRTRDATLGEWHVAATPRTHRVGRAVPDAARRAQPDLRKDSTSGTARPTKRQWKRWELNPRDPA